MTLPHTLRMSVHQLTQDEAPPVYVYLPGEWSEDVMIRQGLAGARLSTRAERRAADVRIQQWSCC